MGGLGDRTGMPERTERINTRMKRILCALPPHFGQGQDLEQFGRNLHLRRVQKPVQFTVRQEPAENQLEPVDLGQQRGLSQYGLMPIRGANPDLEPRAKHRLEMLQVPNGSRPLANPLENACVQAAHHRPIMSEGM